MRSVRRNLGVIVLIITASALVSVLAYAFYIYVRESDYLTIKTVRVDGARYLDPAALVAITGLTTADNIFFLRSSVIRGKIAALPYVKRCRVTRIFPDTVSIVIQEREPVATLLAHTHPFEIDGDGVVLRKLDPSARHPGPFISQVPELGSVEEGQQLTQRPLLAALEVWRCFSTTGVAKHVTVSEIAASGVNDIRMYCDELPYEIRWGRGEFAMEAQRLDTLWRERGGTLPCAEYLDLRFGRDLACR
jgi:cell division protein FtsQ